MAREMCAPAVTLDEGILPLPASTQRGLRKHAGARCGNRAWLPRATAAWNEVYCTGKLERCGWVWPGAGPPAVETNSSRYLQFAPSVSPISVHDRKVADRSRQWSDRTAISDR